MLHCLIKSLYTTVLTVVILVSALVFTAPALATGAYQMPPLSESTWVVDDAELISRINESKITERLQELAQATGNEVRFVTIHRLDYGETTASFADALMEKWFPEPESRTNQTLLVLDEVTNNAALKVGDASAERLDQDIVTSVIDETIAIPLRNGNKYNQALLTASDRLVAVLSGQADPGPPAEATSFERKSTFASVEETEENRSNATIIVVGFLIAATVIPMATYYLYQSIGG
ncbi:MAG: TPM domain-containing protein [Cyanobacteria bacterium P01_C01_bin.120]